MSRNRAALVWYYLFFMGLVLGASERSLSMTRIYSVTCATLLVATSLTAIATASAQTNGQQPGICKDDFAKYCPGVEPNGRAAVDCLKKNVSNLSSACQLATTSADELDIDDLLKN
jgi:hypothetical protein